MAKGSNFEREICKQLGLWWTGGVRDDVFWRSSNSGGRATVRSRTGRRTAGSYGDIVATDPIGKSFTDRVTIECKRGYSKCSIADVLDRQHKAKPTIFEGFIEQASAAAELAKTKDWLLIVRRDSKQAMVYYPIGFHHWLEENFEYGGQKQSVVFVRMKLIVRYNSGPRRQMTVCGMRLEDFLVYVKPHFFQ